MHAIRRRRNLQDKKHDKKKQETKVPSLTSTPSITPLLFTPTGDALPPTPAPNTLPRHRHRHFAPTISPTSITKSPTPKTIEEGPSQMNSQPVVAIKMKEVPLAKFDILLSSESSSVDVVLLDQALEHYLVGSMSFQNIGSLTLEYTEVAEFEETKNSIQSISSTSIQRFGFQGSVLFIPEAPSPEFLHAEQEKVLMNIEGLQNSIDNSQVAIGLDVEIVQVIIIAGSGGGERQQDGDSIIILAGPDDKFKNHQLWPVVIGAVGAFGTVAFVFAMLALRYRAIPK